MKKQFPGGVPRSRRPRGPSGKRGSIGFVGKTGPEGQRGARGAQGEAGSAGASLPAARITGADGVEPLSVVQMHLDNIHRELDAQMHRSVQLEQLLAGMKGQIRELIGPSKLHNGGGRRPGAGLPKLSH